MQNCAFDFLFILKSRPSLSTELVAVRKEILTESFNFIKCLVVGKLLGFVDCFG